MIELVKAEKSENSGQLWMTIFIDAQAAGIKYRSEAARASSEIGKRLTALSEAVTGGADHGPVEQEFREYLREVLFRHYVDVIAINDFIYESRQAFIKYKENVVLAGFNMEYKYYGEVEEDV